MSDDIFQQASFLSHNPPARNISDYSGLLSPKETATLESLSQALHFSPKVIVLPQDFSPSPSALEFSRELASVWRLPAKGFLMVVDLKDHKVRGLAGESLKARGISDTFLTDEVFAQHFVPYMKQNDLNSAVTNALVSVEGKLVRTTSRELADGTRVRGTDVRYDRPPSNFAQLNSSTFLVLLAVLVALVVGGYSLNKRRRAQLAKQTYEKLSPRLDELYKKTDEIAQAAEYLKTDNNAELAERVALFFNRVSALGAAQKDLDSIYKTGQLSDSNDSAMKVAQMVSMLETESRALLPEVNKATGVVGASLSNSPESVAHEFEREAEEKVHKLKIPQREEQFRRPDWAYQPAYYQPVVVNDSGSGLMNLMLVMNQMQMNQRFDNALFDMQRQSYDDNSGNQAVSDGGASWGTDAGWGDGGGDFGGDGGGDFGGDGGGGDFGGGDSGGGGDW